MEPGPSFGGNTLASECALRVALQTMKERCLLLQRRLTELEEDNQTLRERLEQDKPANMTTQNSNGKIVGSDISEFLQLRMHVTELNCQKQQLSEQINMVSNENRKLWSRLSQIANDKNGRIDRITNEKDSATRQEGEEHDDVQISPRNGGSGACQNLTRSKTFTQHTPNPNLRHKLIPNGTELNMEEIALDGYEQSDEIVESSNNFEADTDGELGFAYLNVDDDAAGAGNNDNTDLNAVVKKCMEGLKEMGREALKQQQDLNSAVAVLESKIALQPCADCAKKSQKPEMADKSLETDESLGEVLLSNNKPTSKKVWSNYNEPDEEVFSCNNETEDETLGVDVYYNKVQEVFHIEAADRLCPLCGKKFEITVPFEPFQQHVEAHFIDRDVEF